MKISDDGLEHMISLGFVKESSQEGIFTLYSWKSIEYFCGPPASRQKFNQKGLYIDLNPQQLLTLPKKNKKGSSSNHSIPELSNILEFYESALYLNFSKENKTFKVTSCDGLLTNLFHLELSSEDPSPFRVVKQTRKPFHGIYSPLGSLDQALSDLNVNTNKLWITAAPVMEGNELKGILVGISREQEYGLDSLKAFGISSAA